MRAEAWEGFDLATVDSGINPLVASYIGAPYQARGTDALPSAHAAATLWSGPSVSDLVPTPSNDTLRKWGFGAVGSVLAIVLIAIGLLVIVGPGNAAKAL